MMNLISGNRYLFDTSVFIDLLRNRTVGKRLHHQRRFYGVFVGYSILTETELWMGIKGLRSESRHKEILKFYRRYFINVTIARNAGMFWRELRSKLDRNEMPGVPDCLIAATARFHGLRLVTKDANHMPRFSEFGVIVEPYQDEE